MEYFCLFGWHISLRGISPRLMHYIVYNKIVFFFLKDGSYFTIGLCHFFFLIYSSVAWYLGCFSIFPMTDIDTDYKDESTDVFDLCKLKNLQDSHYKFCVVSFLLSFWSSNYALHIFYVPCPYLHFVPSFLFCCCVLHSEYVLVQ